MRLKHFKLSEFDEPGKPGSGTKMNTFFLEKLDELRDRCSFPFIVSHGGGFRSSKYNNLVSNTGDNGPHTTGKAVDIAVSHKQAYILVQEAMKMGCFTGIGIKQHNKRRFVHLDILTKYDGDYPRPRIWTYGD